MGEDIGTLGGVFTRHRGAEGGVRREPRARHPARRVGHRRHRDRARDARVPPGVRDPVRRVHLPRLRPDHLAAGEADLPARGIADLPRRHPGAVRRAHRRGRAPPGEPGGVLRAHGRPARRQPRDPARRLLDDPGGDREQRPGACSSSRRAATGRRATSTWRRAAIALHASRVVREPAPRSRSSGTARWSSVLLQAAEIAAEEGTSIEVHRPALALADRLRADPRVGAEDRASRRRAGGARQRQRRIRDRGDRSPSGRSTRSRRRCCGSADSTPRSRLPSSRRIYLPDADRVLEAVDRALAY